EAVTGAFQTSRAARNGDPAILAKGAAAQFRQVINIDVHVVHDVEVKLAIVVIITEGGTRSPATLVAHARLRRDIRECSVMIVVIKRTSVQVRDVQIVPAVVVIIADGHAVTPSALL